MPKIRLTDLTIRSLSEGLYFDERTPSFAIRVGKYRKTWLVVKEPNRTKVRLGHYPDLSLAEARRRALVAIGSPYHPHTAPAFPDALNEYLTGTHWKPSSRYELNRTLRRYFLWQKSLEKITHHDVARVIDAITAPSEAAHALKDIKAFFNWCVPRYIDHSPCNGLKPPRRYVPRERLLSDDEICRIWHGAGELRGYGELIRLLICTGQRAGQIIALTPEWIVDDTIQFPASVMKGNKAHVIPLGKLQTS